MDAEKLYMMSNVIYLSLCLGVFLKFKNCGVKGWCLLISLIIPVIGVLMALIAPIKFLEGKEEYTFFRKMKLFPFLVYLTITVFPIIVVCVASRLKDIHAKNRISRQKLSIPRPSMILWPEVEKYYSEATGIRIGI